MNTQKTSYGDIDSWSRAFPPTLIPQIIALTLEAWPLCISRYSLSASDYETRITRRLKYLLQQEKKARRLPLLILREVPEEMEEEEDVEEKGRIDLVFIHGFNEDVYFAFECKRLNVVSNGKRSSLASDYVGTNGLGTFIREWYAKGLSAAGMIGYVMDGDIDFAQTAVNDKIISMREDLKTDNGLKQSTIIPEDDNLKETSHHFSKIMTIHHLFLCLKID